MPRIDDSARLRFLADHPHWTIEGEDLTRVFAFSDFNAAMGFVTRVALAAEVADHHPDIDIRWNKVRIVLSTHSEDALTAKDTDLAAQIDSL